MKEWAYILDYSDGKVYKVDVTDVGTDNTADLEDLFDAKGLKLSNISFMITENDLTEIEEL